MVDRNITSQHFPVQPWPPFVNRINRGDRTAAFWQTVLYDEVPLLAGWSRRGNRREREARLDPELSPMTVCYVETGMGQALRLRAADHSTLIRRADHCLCSSDQSAASDINQPF